VTPAGFPSTMAASPSLPVAAWACTRARPLAATVKSSEEYIIAIVGGLICERRNGVGIWSC